MISWLKYLIIAFVFTGLAAVLFYFSTQQNSNIRATQEVKSALKSSVVGSLRQNYDDVNINKKDVMSNLILDIVKTQKEHGKAIKIDYVFLNPSGSPTELDSEISSIQFRIELLNSKNEVVSKSVQRITLKGDS
ncbi:hypothetical protein NSQ59_27645 [Margalitia sp. FSL K6-0131]|uniref:hypothetical protein n=1 Tax=Margalitia sp. FSL K6-0131 TaxID=2954604 RepID=UPI0030F62111